MSAGWWRSKAVPRPTLCGVALALGIALGASEPLQAEPATGGLASSPVQLELGAEERVRSENWFNLYDFDDLHDDSRHQWRFRTRVWGKLGFGSRATFVVGLDNESRRILIPETTPVWDETVFETLYLDYAFDSRLRLKLGRQNLVRGDGFLFMDGGPLDGSRTQYVNALVATVGLGKSKLDLFAFSDPSQDEYLPVINDKDKPLIEWDEYALGAYYTEGRFLHTTLEAYYAYKQEKDDTRAASDAARQPDRALHTLGARYARRWGSGWSVTAEAAGQLGTQDPETDIRAWGTQGQLKKTFAVSMKPSLAAGWVGLSGDDAATGAIEGWDPLFARFPKWSDLFLYTLSTEKGVGYWSNLAIGQIEFQMELAPPVSLRAAYQRLGAFHPFPGKASLFAGGSGRGDVYAARFDVKPNATWRGHMLAEYLAPGNFYATSDGAWFFRAEVIFALQHVFKF